MPRRPKQPVVIPTRAMTASAVRFDAKASRIYYDSTEWQTECYRHYDICGEAHASARFFGHAMSKIALYATDDGERVEDGSPADKVLAELFNGDAGRAQMQESVGIHFTVAGECYLVGRKIRPWEVGLTISADDADMREGYIWEIVSVLEMKPGQGGPWRIVYGKGMKDIVLTDDDVVIRLWVPNPSRRIEADSAFRALLPILREIEWLTKRIFAEIQSRLAGAGVYWVPQEMDFPEVPQPAPGDGSPPPEPVTGPTAFMMDLGRAMMAPIEDPSNPASLIPYVAAAPGELIGNIKHDTFWSPLDEHCLALRTEAITRFALGMDLPPEQVLGMSSNSGTGGGSSNGVSHWGAWQIEESTIKMHIEPMAQILTDSLTVAYMRPGTNSPTSGVGFTSEGLKLRPDRSRESIELYNMGELSGRVMLRENGFDPDEDAMDDAEYRDWLTKKVASGSATPEMVDAALEKLGVDLGVDLHGGDTNEARPDPTLEDHPTRPRDPSESSLTPLLAASEGLVFRALERAGNRLRGSGAKPPNTPAYETHLHVKANGNMPFVMEDAFSCAPMMLAGIDDPDRVVPLLDSYVSTLISEQSAHSRDRLRQWLALGGVR